MPRKKVCPVGLICMDTQYLLILLSLFILILLYFLFFKNDTNRVANKVANNLPCSKKINNGLVNKYKEANEMANGVEANEMANGVEANEMANGVEANEMANGVANKVSANKIARDIVINYKNEDTSSYLINKDYERIINPLIPPERRNHYMNNNPYEIVRNGVPINIPTRGYSGGIVQVGALYKENIDNDNAKIGNNSETIILPLFGMPVHNGSNKWIYYTTSDKYNQVKLPITNKNKVCNSDYGCDELYENDIVTVPAYNGNFKVVKYEYDKPKYLPHII